MRRLVLAVTGCFVCAFVWSGAARAQGRGSADWMTSNADAQRSSWVRTDAKISPETMRKPGFQFLWKLKLGNDPQPGALMPPALLDLLIGYRGFRTLAFVGSSSDKIFVIDTDLGRMEWEKPLASGAPRPAASPACPGGMTANVTRPTTATLPSSSLGGGGFFGGRRSPARSAVGEPGQGAVTLAQVAPNPTPPPPRAPARGATAAPPAPVIPSIFGGGPFLVYALSSDGRLHTMHLSNGADAEPPVKFLPPQANARGLIVIDKVAYVVTGEGCGGAPDGVWALDLVSKRVATWKANVSGAAGPAFGPDGTLYVGTGAGGQSPSSLVALEPKTLKVKGKYTAGKEGFTSSPVVFEHRGKILIAATTGDGRVHLLDSASLGGADSRTPLFKSPAYAKAAGAAPGALASWQGGDGTRWLLAPVVGPPAAGAGFAAAGGEVTHGAVVAWKVVEQNGAPALEPGWVSRDLVSPLPPTIVNGVVFAAAGGESSAVLYALDGATGKELWNSGTTITSFVRGGALSGGGGQFYLGAHDGTFYAFGFPMEH